MSRVLVFLLLITVPVASAAIELLPDLPFALPTYELYVDDFDWAWLLDNPRTEETIPATFGYRGDRVNARIRFRGARGNREIEEKSFKIYIEDDYEIDGQRTLNLNNGRGSLPFFLEQMSYDVYRALGYPVPDVTPVRLVLNGRFLGVFTRLEPIKQNMLERPENFGPASGGPVYKGRAHLEFFGEESSLYEWRYEKKTNEDEDEWADLIRLCYLLDAASYEEFARDLPGVLDIDHHVEWYAIQSLLAALDNWCCGNYYLYQHPYTRRFVRIPWDYNGGVLLYPDAPIRGGHIIRYPPDIHIEPYPGPLSRVLEIPWVWERFRDRLAELVDEVFIDADWEEALLRLHALTAADFRIHNQDMGRESDYQIGDVVPRILGFVRARRDEVRRQLSVMSPPVIQSFDLTRHGISARPAFPADVDSIVARISIEGAPLRTIVMRDDGLHRDGNAGDGTYGASFADVVASWLRAHIYVRNSERLVTVVPDIGTPAGTVLFVDGAISPNPFIVGGDRPIVRFRAVVPGVGASTQPISVFDAGGRRVAVVPTSSPVDGLATASLPASTVERDFPPGVYFVRLGDRRLGRLVVLR